MTERTLNLERFTTLLAQVVHGGREGEILAQYGIDAESWRRSRRDWLRRLAAVRPPTHEAHVFSTLFARALLELEEQYPTRRKRITDFPISDAPQTVMVHSLEPATMPSACDPSEIEETLTSAPAVEKSPRSRSVDAAAFVLKPLMDAGLDGSFEDGMSGIDATVFGAPSACDEEPVMSPEAYARLACATHLAPSVMRERVHRAMGIANEPARADIDQAMTRYFETDDAAYRVYLGWVAHLRRGA